MAKDDPKASPSKSEKRESARAQEDAQKDEATQRHEEEAARARGAKAPGEETARGEMGPSSIDSRDVARVEREAGMRSPGLPAEVAAAANATTDLRPARPAPRLVYYEGGPCPICGAAVAQAPPALDEKGQPQQLNDEERVQRDYDMHHRVHHAAAPAPVFMKEATASTAQSGAQPATARSEDRR